MVCPLPSLLTVVCPLSLPLPLRRHLQSTLERYRAAGTLSKDDASDLPPDERHYWTLIGKNYSHTLEGVLCIRPSWPNASGVSCLTPSHGVYCPYTDEYRGNLSSVFALGGGVGVAGEEEG